VILGVGVCVGGGQEPPTQNEEIVILTYSLFVLGNLPQT